MSELERLDEALETYDQSFNTPKMEVIAAAARAYRDFLANGPLLGLATTRELLDELRARIEVDAAVGGRLLVDPPKEEDR